MDIKISTNSVEEVTLRRDNYTQLFPKLQDESNASPMHIWFRTAAKEDGKSPISNITYATSSRDTELVSKGFTCIQQNINRNGAFGKHKYIWTSLVPSSTQMTNELIGLSLTSGDLSDKNTARLWLPRHRGFKLVPGNLNEKIPNVVFSCGYDVVVRYPLMILFSLRIMISRSHLRDHEQTCTVISMTWKHKFGKLYEGTVQSIKTVR